MEYKLKEAIDKDIQYLKMQNHTIYFNMLIT